MFDVYDFDPVTIINMFHLQSSETLKNISPELLAEIETLSRRSIRAIASIFEEGAKKGVLVDTHPVALTDIFWACFSGVILWEESKKVFNRDKDYFKKTLETGFELLYRGLKKGTKN